MQGDVEVYGLDGRLLGRWKALTLPVDLPLSTLSPRVGSHEGAVDRAKPGLDSLMRWESHPNRGWGHCVLVCLILLNSAGSGSAQLEDVSAAYAISASTGDGFLGCGLSCADFNGDGWDDLTLSEGDGDVQLHAGGPDGMEFVGNLTGEGTPTGVLWVDIEEDGDLDLWVMRSGGAIQLFVQSGDGVLSEEAELRVSSRLRLDAPRLQCLRL